ncbi:hypothetical protein EDB83DRAFT_2400861 [Lactarius deliciosus]|nr:hypothetical protein EDB83DRAFT_2400861 [Lactarius deliciosus]
MRRLRVTGWPRLLKDLIHAFVLFFLLQHCTDNGSRFVEGCIQWQPDISLEREELQTQLLEVTKIDSLDHNNLEDTPAIAAANGIPYEYGNW